MSWPLSQDYNEAIQSPATNFTDPDLKKGQVVTNALGLPIPFSGNFADVYQVRCPDGSRWAVKCFTREAHGLRERYQEISAWLLKAKLPFTVDFSYLEQGIRIAGKWYPILKMQWVEGLTLNQFVGQYLDKPAMLEALLQLWAKMGKYLRAAQVGHCDLQHGNVLLVPGSTPNALALKLIDYDGMWIPTLAKTQSGEVGHANFQHPRRLREGTYNLEVDRFPLLLVATAMRALKADKALWAKYDNGDNLLFKESDLAAPGQSALFEELASLPDAGLVMLAAQVRAALKGPLESTALLEVVMPETKTAPSVIPARPSRLAPPSAGVTTQKTIPTASAVAVAVAPRESALDFDPVVRKSDASFVKRGTIKKAAPVVIPMAVWIGGAVVIVLLATMVGGLALWAMSGKKTTPDTPMVRNDVAPPVTPPIISPPVTPPTPMPVDPISDPPVISPPVVAPPVVAPPIIAPPVVAQAPDEAADKPGARVVRTYGWRNAGGVRSISVSQDGNMGLTVGVDGVLTQFNPRTGAFKGSMTVAGLGYLCKCAALTPDGRRAVIACGDNRVRVRDLESSRDAAFPTGPLNWVDVSRDGKLAILGGDDGLIYLWDLQRNAVKNRWKGSEKAISLVRFSPNGKIVVSCGQDEVAHFWNVPNGSEIFKIDVFAPDRTASKPKSAAFLSDDLVMLGFSNGAGGVWDVRTHGIQSGGVGGQEVNRTAAASADGELTALAAEDRTGFTVYGQKKSGLWSCPTPTVAPECLVFAPDSRHLVVGCLDGTLHYVAITLPGEETAPGIVKSPSQLSAGLPFDVGWDKPVNPDGDCKFVAAQNSLTIETPAKNHNLTVENGVMNAPRLARDVAGDFTAQVSVSGDFNPVGPSTAAGYSPVTAAGFLLMVDDRTYYRFERAAQAAAEPNNASPFLILEWRINGKMIPVRGNNPAITADKPTILRLQRKGNQLMASVSQDGQKWNALPSLGTLLPPTAKLALSAVTTSAAPFQPRFNDFRLTAEKSPMAVKPLPPAKDLIKPPMGDDLAKEREAVKQEHKADYDKLNIPKDKSDLASKLHAEALATKDKPDRQYALLVEARDLAARGEDLAASQQIITETAAIFTIDPKEAKEAALLAAGAAFSSKTSAKAYLAELKPLLQEAKADDDYERVAPLLPAVRKAALEAHDADMTKIADSLVKLQKEFEAVKKDMQTLKEKPDDADANMAVGKFYSIQKQDWDKGDPFLVKSGNLALATAATKDAEAPKEVAEQVALGDSWMKLADNASLGIRLGAQRRAYDWYSQALPNLSDKEEERVKARVLELTKQFPDVLSAWEGLDVSKVEAVGNTYLRMKAGQMLSTKQPVDGGMEIVLVARAAKPPSFEFLKGKAPIVVWQVGYTGVTGARVPRGRSGIGTWGGNTFQFTPSVWVTYTCKLQDAKMDCLVDGKPYFFDVNKNDLSKSATIQLKAGDQTLEVKSFTVNPLDKP